MFAVCRAVPCRDVVCKAWDAVLSMGKIYRNRSRTVGWRVGEGDGLPCSSANYSRGAMDGKEAGEGQVPKGEQHVGILVIELG